MPTRRAAPIVGCLVLTMVAQLTLRAGDWPTYQHDNARGGVTHENLAAPLSLKWVHEPAFPPARGWPDPAPWHARDAGIRTGNKMAYDDAYHVVAAGDSLYFCASAENRIACLDAATGRIRWSVFTDAPPRLAPTVWRDRIYVGADDGFVYCLSAADGASIWKFRTAPDDGKMIGHGRLMSCRPVRTGVVIEDGVAYFGAGVFPNEGLSLFAVDAANGKLIWENSEYDKGGRGNLTPQGYLLASDTQLIMPSGRVCPGVFDRETGRLLYQVRGGNNMMGGTYAMLAGHVLFNGTHVLTAYDMVNAVKDKYGKEVRGPPIYSWYQGKRVVVHDETAYILTDSQLYALPLDAIPAAGEIHNPLRKIHYRHRYDTTTHRRRQARLARLRKEDPEYERLAKEIRDRQAVYDEVLVEEEKINAAVDPSCRWRLQCDASESLILAGDVLFAGGADTVIAVDAGTGKSLWSHDVEGRARGLAVANQYLFVSTTTGNIYCFEPDRATAKKQPTTISPTSSRIPYPRDDLTAFYAKTADDIVGQTAIKKGFCLVLGGGNGRLAFELATRTELRIYVVEPDQNRVVQARQLLSQAGLYGGRIVVEQGSLESLALPLYFANLVVSEEAFLGDKLSTPPGELLRVLRPLGGVACVGRPPGATGSSSRFNAAVLDDWLKGLAGSDVEIRTAGSWAGIVRGELKGAGEWTHQYGNPGNTDCSEDRLARPPFGVLWFADEMVNPGENPLITARGRLFMSNLDIISATDAYNGTLLWQRRIPGATRSGATVQGANIAADDKSVYLAITDTAKCLRLDAATGETLQTYRAPPREDSQPRRWGWTAVVDDQLFGSRTDTAGPYKNWPKHRGHTSECIFALDVKTGRPQWLYEGKAILPATIAIDGGKLFLVDSALTDEQRQQAIRERDRVAGDDYAPRLDKKGSPVPDDVRLVVALDAKTGRQLWARPLDVTDCIIHPNGGEVRIMCKDDVLMVCGAPWNGHYLKQWSAGEFERRTITALDATRGKLLWSGRKGYRSRPIVVGDVVFAEPWKHDLQTGEIRMSTHPLTGLEQKWNVWRGYGYCGNVVATASTIFFRPNTIGYYDLERDYGIEEWGGQRPTCNNNCISGNGLVLAAGGQGHCVCPFALSVTVALYHKPEKISWGTYGLGKPLVPVTHIALNLGAPGDRRDGEDTIWLHTPSRVHKWHWVGGRFRKDGNAGYYYNEGDIPGMQGTDEPWIFACGARGLQEFSVPMTEEGKAERYTVRLYFAEPDEVGPGERVFDVSLQGKQVLQGFDIVRESGGPRKALVKEFEAVEISGSLRLELGPSANGRLPVLCGVEARKED